MQATLKAQPVYITPFQALQATNMAEGVLVACLNNVTLVARPYGWASLGPAADDAPIPLSSQQATKLLQAARANEVAQRGQVQWGTLSANGAS